MTGRQLSVRVIFSLAVLFVIALPARAGEWTFNGIERVVAISDIHGAYGAMIRTLQSAQVLDEELSWSGDRAHLVIVGDILDRGPESRDAMDLLMRLEDEAASAGGRVHVLLGNHEVMNLIGDLRYVSDEEYAAFAADESEEERERWFKAYSRSRVGDDAPIEEHRRAFDEKSPPGFFAHRNAFASEGRYGRWLLSKQIMIVIDGTAFVHGGISPLISEIGLQGVNETLHDKVAVYVRQVEKLIEAGILLPTDTYRERTQLLRDFTAAPDVDVATLAALKYLNGSEVYAVNGPFWYRGNAYCGDLIETDRLQTSLQAIGAQRVVIGHTPTPGRRIYERLGGRVIEVDTGMLNSYYSGHGNALVISGDELSIITESGKHWPAPTTHPRDVGARQSKLDTAKLEALLANGEALATGVDVAGRQLVSILDGENVVNAVFSKRTRRNFYPEVAAYRIDLLLGLDMVPVAVKREFDGVEGSLQFLPAGTIDENKRAELGGDADCPFTVQWNAMLIFDALIFNEGRSVPTISYDQSTWNLILAGHSKTFAANKSIPKNLANVELDIGATWIEALLSLTDELLKEQLGDVLDKRRLRALGARRDALLEIHP
ncbi:MAG: metallophosphoesterase [Proteobacteria bacterium]|nr:metallophosphoesterase [Pseudomonadota bacterium]